MENPIKTLQTSLAQDLVKLEETNISEEHLQMIETTYEQVYRILDKASKE
jgi:hypothetical protein